MSIYIQWRPFPIELLPVVPKRVFQLYILAVGSRLHVMFNDWNAAAATPSSCNTQRTNICVFCTVWIWHDYPPVLFYRWCRYLCLWPLNFTPKNSLVNIPTIVLVISKRQSKFSPRQSVYIYTSISLKTKFSPWQFFLHLKNNNQKLSLVPKNLIYTSIS